MDSAFPDSDYSSEQISVGFFQFVSFRVKKPAARKAGGAVCGATERPAMAHSLCKNLHKNYGNLSVVMVEKFGEKEASKWK